MDINQIISEVCGVGKKTPLKSIYQQEWLWWYRGKVMGFHNYRVYNGDRYMEMQRKTLAMAKKICETWASLLLTEKCDIILPDKPKQIFDQILEDTNFWVKAGGAIEKSFALGLGAFVLGIHDLKVGDTSGTLDTSEANIKISFVNATKIRPITVEDKQITECAFTTKNSDTTSHVLHVKDASGKYVIHSYLIGEDGKVLTKYTFPTGSKLPWFFILRPNVESNIMTDMNDEEIGVSIYSNALDILKAIDNKYDGFDAEFVLNRPIQFVSAEATRVSLVDGELRKTFDPMETRYYHLPTNADGTPFIETKAQPIRFEAYIQGINAELNYLSMSCGLGENYYKFDGRSVATATQVISENSTLYRNIVSNENLLRGALRDLTRAVIYASNTFTNNKIGEVQDKDITIKFDDSIIEDKESEMKRDREDVVAGLMTKVEYRMRWYGEDEKTAAKKVQEFFLYEIIDNYTSALTSGLMTPEQFVDTVYPGNPKREEIIAYVTEFIAGSRQPENDPYSEDPDADIEDDQEDPNNPEA